MFLKRVNGKSQIKRVVCIAGIMLIIAVFAKWFTNSQIRAKIKYNLVQQYLDPSAVSPEQIRFDSLAPSFRLGYKDMEGDGDYESILVGTNSDGSPVELIFEKGLEGKVNFINLSEKAVSPYPISQQPRRRAKIDYVDLNGDGILETKTYLRQTCSTGWTRGIELIDGRFHYYKLDGSKRSVADLGNSTNIEVSQQLEQKVKYMTEEICEGIFRIGVDSKFLLDNSNIYLLNNLKGAIVIDTGEESNREFIKEQIEKIMPLTNIKKVLLTHMHYDHCGNVDIFPDAEIYASQEAIDSYKKNPSGKFDDVELKPLPDNIIGLKVIKTPGHTCGSVCFYFREGKILFSGDTKFSGATIGRTDLATSDPEMMSKSLETISKIGYEVICPGHNY